MTGIDIFALIILLVLLLTAVAVWVVLGMYPGKIARQRNHPQAEAIAVCGWWGVITLGLLLPVAWIWAYTKTTNENDPGAEVHKTSSTDRETSDDKGVSP
jgi:type VI protein secretion system component VasK